METRLGLEVSSATAQDKASPASTPIRTARQTID